MGQWLAGLIPRRYRLHRREVVGAVGVEEGIARLGRPFDLGDAAAGGPEVDLAQATCPGASASSSAMSRRRGPIMKPDGQLGRFRTFGVDELYAPSVRVAHIDGRAAGRFDIYPDSSETRKKLWQSGR